METCDLELTSEDHAYRHAARTYFEEKARAAHELFDPKTLEVFLAFQEHWRDFFAPDEDPARREYLQMPFEVRKSQFERFKRECRTWELSFRTSPRNGAGARSGLGSDWSDLKRRLDAQRQRTEEVRSYYDALEGILDRERQRNAHPIELLVHLRALDVPADASLEDIKRQYKRLAKLHHPDRHGDALKMSRINDAYRAIMSFYRVA